METWIARFMPGEPGIPVQSRYLSYNPVYLGWSYNVEVQPHQDKILNYDYVCSSSAYVVKLNIDEVM
jgi:hypothetical protein